MWIIAYFIILFTVCIIGDTNIKEYFIWMNNVELREDYDIEIPLWAILVIVLLGIIPIVNIVIFIIFIIWYSIHASLNPEKEIGSIHVFSFRGSNIITKCLLKIKKILIRKI